MDRCLSPSHNHPFHNLRHHIYFISIRKGREGGTPKSDEKESLQDTPPNCRDAGTTTISGSRGQERRKGGRQREGRGSQETSRKG